MARRASDILLDDSRHASDALFERASASPSKQGAERKPSSRLKDRPSSRMGDPIDAATSTSNPSLEKKLSKRDRSALTRKYAKRIALTGASLLHDTLDADASSGDAGQDMGRHVQNAAAREGYAALGEKRQKARRTDERIDDAAKKGRARNAPDQSARHVRREAHRKAKAGARQSGGGAEDASAAFRRPAPAPAGRVGQKTQSSHIRKTVDGIAKERAQDVSRRVLVKKKMIAKSASAMRKKTGSAAKAASRHYALAAGARRSSTTVLARAFGGTLVAASTVLPIMAVVLVLSTAIGGSLSQSAFNTEGLNENERQIALFLRDKGLGNVQIAAIMGNLRQESDCNPNSVQVPGRVGGGIGICQWGYGVDGGRGNAMERWAQARGNEWNSLSAQLDWMWAEMVNEGPAAHQTSWYSPYSSPGKFERFSSMTSVSEAVGFWERWMEAAGDPRMEVRISYAMGYLAIFDRNSNTAADAGAVIELAFTKLGAPYVFGASGPDEFDCSGFVKWCMESCGVDLHGARTADQIYRISTPIGAADARSGDIVAFRYGTPGAGETYGHIGLYLGDGMMIETSTPAIGVNVRPVGASGSYGRL